jgi:fructokinase
MISELLQLDNDLLERSALKICKHFGLQSLIVTLGEKGAVLVNNQDRVLGVQPGKVDNLLDTVGAGDAFSAVAIIAILENWALDTLLEMAAAFAAKICTVNGATVKECRFYQTVLNEWKAEDGWRK